MYFVCIKNSVQTNVFLRQAKKEYLKIYTYICKYVESNPTFILTFSKLDGLITEKHITNTSWKTKTEDETTSPVLLDIFQTRCLKTHTYYVVNALAFHITMYSLINLHDKKWPFQTTYSHKYIYYNHNNIEKIAFVRFPKPNIWQTIEKLTSRAPVSMVHWYWLFDYSVLKWSLKTQTSTTAMKACVALKIATNQGFP